MDGNVKRCYVLFMKLAEKKVLTPERTLPATWWQAAGILKGKKRTEPLVYQSRIRAEWDRRLKRTLKKK